MQIIYTWDLGDPRFELAPGKVVYRELDGVRRWDAMHQGFENPLTGTAWIVSADGTKRCLWVRTSVHAEEAASVCGSEALSDDAGVLPGIIVALSSKHGDVERETVIAGKSARCAPISDIPTSEVCVDASSGILLSLAMAHPRTRIAQRITADQVSEESVATLDMPSEPGAEFPLVDLHLPDAITFR